MSLRIHVGNPAEAVEAAFHRIRRERMADLAMLNPALSIEAIGFQRWQGHWLGVLVTPWCMSLLRVPGSEAAWTGIGQNRRGLIRFPVGDLPFLASDEPELGEFQSCSLFSPMDRFATHADATMTARASMLALLAPPAVPATVSAPDGSIAPAATPASRETAAPSESAAATGSAGTPAAMPGVGNPSVSRRRFLALGGALRR